MDLSTEMVQTDALLATCMLYLEFLVCMSRQFVSSKLPTLLGQSEIC